MSDPNDPARDMTKSGYVKETTYNYVKVDDEAKKIYIDKIAFYVKDMTHDCDTNAFLWLVPQRSGVYLACLYCGTVTGPITRDLGVFLESKEISQEEAIEILLRQGSQMRDRDVQHIKKLFMEPAKSLAQKRPRPKEFGT